MNKDVFNPEPNMPVYKKSQLATTIEPLMRLLIVLTNRLNVTNDDLKWFYGEWLNNARRKDIPKVHQSFNNHKSRLSNTPVTIRTFQLTVQNILNYSIREVILVVGVPPKLTDSDTDEETLHYFSTSDMVSEGTKKNQHSPVSDVMRTGDIKDHVLSGYTDDDLMAELAKRYDVDVSNIKKALNAKK